MKYSNLHYNYRKSIFLSVVLALIIQVGFAQEEALRLDEILALKRSHYEDQGLDEEKIQKKLAKFMLYWRDRLNEDGTLGKFTAAFPSPGGRAVNFCTNDPAQWSLVGPHSNQSNAYDGQAALSHKQWDGLMEEVYAPSDMSYTLAASARGGIWKRESGDPGWTNVTDALNFPFFKVSAIISSPFDDDHLFASCGGETHGQGIITSTDGGDTWSILSGFTNSYCAAFPSECTNGNDQYIDVRKVIADPHSGSNANNMHLYALTHSNPHRIVWKSTDGGQSWSNLGAPTLPSHHIWVDIEVDLNGKLFVTSRHPYGADARLFTFTTGWGWVDDTPTILPSTPSSPSASNVLKLRISKPHGAIVFAALDRQGTSNREVYKSTNAGASWTLLGSIGPAIGWGGQQAKIQLEYSPSKDEVYVGGNRLIEMEGSTGTWSSIPQGHIDIRDIFLRDSGSDLYIYTANDGGVSKRDYNANTWQDLNGGSLPVLEFYDIGSTNTTDEHYLGGVAHNHAYQYSNGAWSKFGSGDGNAAIINPDNAFIGYVTYGWSVLGYNFNNNQVYGLSPGAPAIPNNAGQFFHYMEINPSNSDELYYAKGVGVNPSNSTHLNLWNEVNNSWTSFSVPYLNDMGEIGVFPNSPNIIYIADGFSVTGGSFTHKLVKSTDGGSTWSSIGSGGVYDASGSTLLGSLNNILAWQRITDIQVHPSNSNTVWISISGFRNADEQYRVLKSIDGGATWREDSQGLPRYPVHSLEYHDDNGVMFAGTEAGVFYRTPSMSQWECFNQFMPYAVVHDLDINDCTNELIAATNGRGIWKTPIPGSLNPTEITTNTTFPGSSTNQYVQDLVVKAPATLTINGTVEMAHNTRLIVEPGARLVVDGGLVTNICDKLWAGIHVGGTPSMAQQPAFVIMDPNQGTVVIKNNATIEHAIDAVTTASGPWSGDAGGRIFADGSSFIDNRFGVVFSSYSANGGDNVSYVRNCTFETTGWLGDPAYEDQHNRLLGGSAHIKMWDVDYVELKNNVFKNTGTFDQDIRGMGIDAFDASYVVDNCDFMDLSIGIRYISVYGSNTLKVKTSAFDNVVQGITCTGGDNIDIDANSFSNYIGSTSYGGIDFMQAWGVYLDGTNGVAVENNEFSTSAFGINDKDLHARGVIAVNTGQNFSTTLIKSNVFSEGSMIAILGWYDNGRMQTRCNAFYSDYAIYIDRVTQGITAPSLFPTQGSFDDPTGNQYYYGCGGFERHLYFDAINPLMANNPPVFQETILEYYNFDGFPYEPVCRSNDFSTLAYGDPGNLPPGYVEYINVGEYDPYFCESVDQKWEPGEEGFEAQGSTFESEERELLNSILAGLNATDRSYFELNPSELESLESLAPDRSTVGSKAQAILSFIGKDSHEPFSDPLLNNGGSVSGPTNTDVDEQQLAVYPNPASQRLNIQLQEMDNGLNTINIYNSTGKLIYNTTAKSNIIVEVDDWTPGVYFIRMESAEKTHSTEFIISK